MPKSVFVVKCMLAIKRTLVQSIILTSPLKYAIAGFNCSLIAKENRFFAFLEILMKVLFSFVSDLDVTFLFHMT